MDHPQTDGKAERVNHILEGMLSYCTLTYGAEWEENLLYAIFSYDNIYHLTIRGILWTQMSSPQFVPDMR